MYVCMVVFLKSFLNFELLVIFATVAHQHTRFLSSNDSSAAGALFLMKSKKRMYQWGMKLPREGQELVVTKFKSHVTLSQMTVFLTSPLKVCVFFFTREIS